MTLEIFFNCYNELNVGFIFWETLEFNPIISMPGL